MQLTLSLDTLLSVSPIIFILFGIIPILKSTHNAKINLSVWAVIVANSWLAALGNVFSDKVSASAIYLLVNAALLTPVLITNINRGVWGKLPLWHKFCAFILPLGVILGISLGGEMATYTSCVVSLMLMAQLTETIYKGIVREHLGTWTWFLISDGLALTFGWQDSNNSFRLLLSLWVLQCLVVMALEARNRIKDAKKENLLLNDTESAQDIESPQTLRFSPLITSKKTLTLASVKPQ